LKKQRILSLLLALAMVFSLLPANAMAADVKNFDDVSKDDWFYKYVDFVTEKDYFVGTSETTFAPEMAMTRAMFVVVLAALEGVKVDNNVAPFADVPANTWYSGAVAWAAEKGVVAGVGNNKFAPDTAISREQMAVMMDAYVEWHSEQTGKTHKEKSKVESFKDAEEISSWAAKSVEKCRNWGLIAGMPDGNFWPANTASRAEVATVIYNLAWLIGGSGGSGGGGGGGGQSHTHTMTHYPAKAANCSETGNSEYWYCSGCNKYFSDAAGSSEIAKDSWVIEKDPTVHPEAGATVLPAVAPTCTQTGLTEGKKCACGDILVAQEVVPMIPHTPADAVREDHIAATADTDGCYDMVVYCSVCGTELERTHHNIPALGGGDEPIIPDPEQPIDYIYNAVSSAVADVKGDIEDKIGTNLPTGGDAYWKDAYVKVTGVKLGTENDKRAVEVVATADIGTEAIKSIVKFSAVNAVKLAGGLVAIADDIDMNDVAAVKAKIVELVEKTVDVLENKMGVDITLSKASIADIAEYIYAVCKDGANGAYNYGASYVKSLREHFVEDDGYVTGDVNVTVGGYTVTIDVEQYAASLVELSGDEKVVAMATSIAKAALDKLQQKVDGAAVYAAAKDAAIAAIGATGAVVSQFVDAEALAADIIAALESKLGIDLNRQYIVDLANEIYDYCKSKAPAIRDDAEDVKDILAANRERATAVAYIAAGMAKEMYNSLKVYNDYTDLNDIVLSTTVKVEFSGEYSEGNRTAYADDTDQFPYVYPITFKMQMDNLDSDTTIGDNIQYKYDNGHFVNIVVTENAKAAYENMILTAKDKVLSLDVIENKVNEIVSGAGLDTLTVYNKVYAAVGGKMEDVLVNKLDMNPAEAAALVQNALTSWVQTNVPADITKSPLIDLFVTGSSDGNQALYDLVKAVADQTVVYAKNYNMLIYVAAKDNDFETFVADLGTIVPELDSMYEVIEAAGLNGLETYILAYLFDSVRTVNGELVSEIDEPAAFTPEVVASMQSMIDAKLVSVAKDAVAAKVNAEQLEALKQLEKLGALASIDSFKNAELGSLAPILTNKYVQKVVAKFEDNIVARYTALLRFIPDEAALVLPNGAVVSEAALADVRDAQTFGDACQAVAALLKEFGGLSLSDFGTTQKFTVKYGARQASFGLQIEIAE